MIDESFEPQCRLCGITYDVTRYHIGFMFCMPCGDEVAHSVKRTVVPMHKSNMVMVTDLSLLKGLNKYAND